MAFLYLFFRPDTRLDLTDMRFLQQEHAQTALSYSPADGIWKPT